MKSVSTPVVIFFLFALMVFAPACGVGHGFMTGQTQQGAEDSSGDDGESVSLPPEGATAMSHSAFSDLKRRVEDAHMSSDKLGVISTASASNYFRAAQVEELVGMLNMSSDRVTVVETTVHRILDLENSHVILDAMTFGQERREAEGILQGVAEKRERERTRIAEEERERARIAEEEERERARQSDSSKEESSGGGGSAYCCLGDAYNECDNAAAARDCVNYGMCIFSCMTVGDAGCEQDCLDENPRVEQCRAVPEKDHLCDD